MRAGKHTAKAFAEALSKAEGQLVQRTENEPRYVKLRPSEIEVRPELFQPREFLYGTRDVDKDHVKKLEQQMGYKGELEPIVVIRLGETWVCVDGHHRLAAYKKKKWKKPIKCAWFTGNAREAADASVSSGGIVKLEMKREDKFENAWKRVLLSDPEQGIGWSKSELVRICSVGDGTVAEMRRAKKAYHGNDDFSIRFRNTLEKVAGKRELSELSWWAVQRCFNGTEKTIDLEDAARELARSLRGKMENRLSQNPEVTARALDIYDAELPKLLLDALWELNEIRQQKGQTGDDADEGPLLAELMPLTLYTELRRAEARRDSIKAELARRKQDEQDTPAAF